MVQLAIFLRLKSKTPFNTISVIPPPMRHLRARGPQKDENEQQISIEPRVQRRSTDISPLIPEHPPIPVQVEIGESSNKEGRERPRAEVSIEDCSRRKEDRRVPKVEARARKFLV